MNFRISMVAVLAIGASLSTAVIAQSNNAELTAALSSEVRGDTVQRDKYRNPAATLEFFQVKPEHTIVEYGPGGGWYTRILLPYVAEKGQYLAVNADSEGRQFRSRAQEGSTKSWPERFPSIAAEWTGVDARKITAFESDEAPEDRIGTVDRILIFRSMHGMLNGDRSDTEIKALRTMLADDGLVGVVQHRADADARYGDSNGSRGYLKQDDVLALFKLNGFELVGSSEINANPKDTKDYDVGVWRLPPVLARLDADDEATYEANKAKYQAIGESDRMTLLFRKAK